MGPMPWSCVAMLVAATLGAPPFLVAQAERRPAPSSSPVDGPIELGLRPADLPGSSEPGMITLDIASATLDEVLTRVGRAAAVRIMYGEYVLDFPYRITVRLNSVSLEESLDVILRGTGLVTRTLGRDALLVIPATELKRPVNRLGSVAGRVVDGLTLEPIPGVQVHALGTDRGAVTNGDGRFTLIALPHGEHTVRATVIGYGAQDHSVAVFGGKTASLTFTLEEQAIALQELIVVAYGSQSRAVVTGSVSQLNSEQIRRNSATTAGDALVGKMPGVNTRSGYQGLDGREARDGRPGAPPMLEIRNMGEPLFVIDGVPRNSSDFNNLNPADIETVSILKDASASVYGFRAANGVVLVTTKRGPSLGGKTQLSIDGYYGMQHLPRELFPFGYGVTAYQQIYSYLESEQNRGQARTRTPEELDSWLNAPTFQTWPAVVNRQNAPQYAVNASVSGGSTAANYYLSLGHVNQDYVMIDNNFGRSNAQVNLRVQLFNGLAIGTELSGRTETHKNIAATSVNDPVMNLFRAVQSPHSHQDWFVNGNPSYIANDVRILARSPPTMRRDISGYQDQIERNVAGNFWTEYTFPFGVRLKGTFSQQYDTEDFDSQTKPFDAYCYDAAGDNYFVCGGVYGPSRRLLRGEEQSTFAQALLSYSGQTGAHSLSGTVAYEIAGSEASATELLSTPPLKSSHLINGKDVTDVNNTWDITRRASYIGRLNYDYQQKYMIEGLARYDGSYLYAEDKRWGVFPAFSLGWRVTEESFLRDRFDFLSEFKLRVAWGQAGREQLPNNNANWSYLGGATYGPVGFPQPPGVTSSAILDGERVTGIRPRGLPITNLSWVTSSSRNVGIDFALFEGKLSGEFDVFERKLTGLPASRYDVVLPSEVGYSLPDENLNSSSNVGFDGVLRYSDRIGNLRYSLSPNITVARARNLDRYKPRYGNSWLQYRNGAENRWSGLQYGLQVIGQFQSVEEIMNHPVNVDGQGNRTLLPGDYIYEDVNRDGLVNTLDERPIGWPTGIPLFQYGFNGSFGYGAFTLSYDLNGGSLFSQSLPLDLQIPYNADHGGAAYWNSRWRRADVFNDDSEWVPGRYPPLRRGDLSHSSYRANDITTTNKTFLRLNRLEVGFSLPQDLANRFFASSARLYASAANPYVAMFYDQRWAQDPENGGNQLYPKSEVYNVGFHATLGGFSMDAPVVPVPPTSDD